jgi:hypothetical protein
MDESRHFEEMLKERGILREWVDRTVAEPETTDNRPDGTIHYLKRIPENGNRWLRVVVNNTVEPPRKVTAFFDRRLRQSP